MDNFINGLSSIGWFIVTLCCMYLIILFFQLLGKIIEWLLTPYWWLCGLFESDQDKKDKES